MSRHATPTDNSVIERYNRTFKYHKKFFKHKVEGLTIQETIDSALEKNPEFKHYRSIVKMYIDDLNKKPNKKSKNDSPKIKDKKVDTASMLMIPPPYPKACSKRVMDDPRLKEVKKYEQAR